MNALDALDRNETRVRWFMAGLFLGIILWWAVNGGWNDTPPNAPWVRDYGSSCLYQTTATFQIVTKADLGLSKEQACR